VTSLAVDVLILWRRATWLPQGGQHRGEHVPHLIGVPDEPGLLHRAARGPNRAQHDPGRVVGAFCAKERPALYASVLQVTPGSGK
jgi:hypothetical protein